MYGVDCISKVIKILTFVSVNLILFFTGLLSLTALGIQMDVHLKGYVVLYSVFIGLPMLVFLLKSLKSK